MALSTRTGRGGRRRRGSRLVAGLAVAAVVAVAGGAALHLARVHEQTWQWRWTSTADPPKVRYAGRDYLRGGDVAGPLSGEVRLGPAPDGRGELFGTTSASTATVMSLRTADGRWVGYSLSGGP